jgi:transcriptional regulator with XRE-family HTH domain
MTAIDHELGKPLKKAVLRQLGRNLAALRDRRHWSQEKLARTAGVTRGRLSKWETGEHGPPIEGLAALAAALGVGLEEVVAGIVNQFPAPISASGGCEPKEVQR